MDESIERLLKRLWAPGGDELSPEDMIAVKEGLYWAMQVVPMLILVPASKICVLIERERCLAQDWLARAWQYKSYIPHGTQLPLDAQSEYANGTCFDIYWGALMERLGEGKGPSLALLDVVFYLLVTFANGTGAFSEPAALRKDAQDRLCQFIHGMMFRAMNGRSPQVRISPHICLFIQQIMGQSPGSLAEVNLILLEQYVLQGMQAQDPERKMAAVSLYQALKRLQGDSRVCIDNYSTG